MATELEAGLERGSERLIYASCGLLVVSMVQASNANSRTAASKRERRTNWGWRNTRSMSAPMSFISG
jgi:hypothetical protein